VKIRLKVAHLISFVESGTEEELLTRIIEGSELGQSLVVSIGEVSDVFVRRLADLGVPLFLPRLTCTNAVVAHISILNLLAKFEPDVVSAWGLRAGFTASFGYLRNRRWRLFLSVKHGHFGSRIKDFLWRLAFRLLRILSVSSARTLFHIESQVKRPDSRKLFRGKRDVYLNINRQDEKSQGFLGAATILMEAYKTRVVAAFPRYPEGAASSRVRMYQFIAPLQESFWEVSFSPFASADSVSRKYAGRRIPLRTIGSYVHRLFALRKARRADLIWVQREVMPWMPHWIEVLTLPPVPTVYDFDDAIHVQHSSHQSKLARVLLRGKVGSVGRRVECVVVGNRNLQKHMLASKAKKVVLIPSVVEDSDVTNPRPVRGAIRETFRFGWIGTPITYGRYLRRLIPTFSDIADEIGGEFWVIGSGVVGQSNSRVQYFDWTKDTEAKLLDSLDVGIMPLEDDEWSRGKCGYKLLQYMARGIPVLASPVGANEQIVANGQNGFLVYDLEEWRVRLCELSENDLLRVQLGNHGRALVQESFTVATVSQNLIDIFDSLVT